MSTPKDLPLDNRSGNLYDPLFADRIAALGKSSGGSSAPKRPSGNGAGWPVGVVVFLVLALLRGCTSSSTSNSRSGRYGSNRPNRTERLDQSRRIQQMLEEKRRQEGIRHEFDNAPVIGGRAQKAEEELRKIREEPSRALGQQPPAPAAPDGPGRGP